MSRPTNLGALGADPPEPSKLALIDLGGSSGPGASDHGASDHGGGSDPEAGGEPRRYSFAELNAIADAVARGLRRRGLAPGERVAIVSDNRMEFLASYLGIMRAGLVVVPISCRAPPALVAYILQDSGARLVLADRPGRRLCPPGLPCVEFAAAGADGFEALLDRGPWAAVPMTARDAAVILYTSGSTGRPKGVVLSHAGYLWSILTRVAALRLAPHRFLVAAPLYHMNALNTVQLALAGGATIVLQPRFQAAAYVQAVARYRCTWLTAIPTMIALIAGLPRQTLPDLSSVQVLRLGSEPITRRIIELARTLFPEARVANGYGTTESGAVVFGAHPDGRLTPDLALGHPLPEVDVRIVDAGGAQADEGVLQIRSPGLMLGYHGMPQQQAAAMTADGYYVTGDVVRREADGFVYFVGRADDMFVCGGENVYPIEVEALLERHPDVAQACVVPVEDAVKGRKPVAVVVRRPGAALSEQALKDYALRHGPAHQHPRAVHFVDRLPVSGPTKIDRKAVAALVRDRAAPAPGP